ncbi:MAG: type II toxin-antitoxin system prevent-host-death family antitoxin [Gammaproteobacteria bacterium]|nr:type II toxin-antitoxin system prevent-host-death family antitoxin [Gammaproteobacteria bacterium]
MNEVSIRDLRNRGAAVIDRVLAGECLKVTRSGRPVAELRPLPRRPISAAVFLARVRNLPRVDPDALRNDIDAVIDPRL